jgi:hypothetical protein
VAPEELFVALVMLVASALVCGTIGLFFSACIRSTIGAAALSYGAMLLPVVALPIVFGIVLSFFGALVSSTSSQNVLWAYYVFGFIYSLNPFIAGGLTEVIIANNKSLFFFTWTVPGAGGGTLYAVGPWLIYTAMALLTSVVLFVLSLRFARPTRGARPAARK